MRKARNYISILALVIIISVLSGCRNTVNINDYINKNAPLGLGISKADSSGFTTTKSLEIAVNSEKYLRLIEWGNKRTSGWQWAPASYISEVTVAQGNFILKVLKGNAVVISFINKEGKPKQLSNALKPGELDFLTK